jgi:hypothetical protein
MDDGATAVMTSSTYLPPTPRSIRHARGPLWDKYDEGGPLDTLATFIGDEVTEDASPLPFKDHPAIVYGSFGQGRVILSASHPELADGTLGNLGMIPEMIRWLAGSDE